VRSSSGSSCCESAVEPTRSQNITVNCRRSASAEGGGVAFLARSAPLRLRLLAGAGLPSVFRAVPHSGQNFAVGRACRPQLGQSRTHEAPHSSQNLAPSGFSNPQLAQRMLPLYSFGLPKARKTSRSRVPDNRFSVPSCQVFPDSCSGSLLRYDRGE